MRSGCAPSDVPHTRRGGPKAAPSTATARRPLFDGHPDAGVGCVVVAALRADVSAVVLEVGRGDRDRDRDRVEGPWESWRLRSPLYRHLARLANWMRQGPGVSARR